MLRNIFPIIKKIIEIFSLFKHNFFLGLHETKIKFPKHFSLQ